MSTGSPVLVQHVSESNTRVYGLGQTSPYCYDFPLPNPTTSGNAVVVGFTFQGNQVTPSVTDDQNDSYTIAVNYFDGTDNQSAGIATALNVAGGARKIALCFSGDPGANIQPMATELTNVIGIDGNGSGNNGNGTAVTSGELTPSASGDLAYQIAYSISQQQSSFSAGSGQDVAWNLLSADLADGWGGQFGVDSTTASFAPTMGIGSADNWVTAAVLLKTGTTGSVPAGLRIVHLLHQDIPYHMPIGTGSPFANPVASQFPCSGNLLVAMIGGGNNPLTVTGLQDSSGNTWSAAVTNAYGDATVAAYYAAQPTCSDQLRVSTQFSAADGDYTAFFYDVANAAAAPLDTSFTAGNIYSTPGDFAMPGSLTPAGANEIVFTEIMWDFNTAVGMTPGLFDCAFFTGEPLDGFSPVDENNGWGHYIATSTNPVSFTWDVEDTASDPIMSYAALAVAFEGQ